VFWGGNGKTPYRLPVKASLQEHMQWLNSSSSSNWLLSAKRMFKVSQCFYTPQEVINVSVKLTDCCDWTLAIFRTLSYHCFQLFGKQSMLTALAFFAKNRKDVAEEQFKSADKEVISLIIYCRIHDDQWSTKILHMKKKKQNLKWYSHFSSAKRDECCRIRDKDIFIVLPVLWQDRRLEEHTTYHEEQ
jgi:hypothetical protein